MEFVQAKWFHIGRRKAIRLIVIHCTVSPESSTGAEAVARYFATTTRRASAHRTADNNSTVMSVRDGDTAFAAAGANSDGIHMELVGYANQSKVEWLDDYSLAELAEAGKSLRYWSRTYDIPPRWLTIDQIQAGERGFCTHGDISVAYPDVSTGHYDPGPNFPKARAMAIWFPPAPSPSTILGDSTMTVLRRALTPTHSVLVVIDKTSPIGVRGFMSEDKGISSPDEVELDASAWHGIVDNWLVKHGVLTKV